MKVDVLGGNPLTNCPFPDSSLPPTPSEGAILHFPTVSLSYFVFFASFVIQGLRTLLKYNTVKIFNRKIDHPSVLNKEISVMFFTVAASFLIDGIRYSLNLPISTPRNYNFNEEQWFAGPHIIDAWLLLGSSILRSMGLLFLSLGLNQQIMYRSKATSLITGEEEEEIYFSPISPSQTNIPEEETPLLETVDVLEHTADIPDQLHGDSTGYFSPDLVLELVAYVKTSILSIKFGIYLVFATRVLLLICST